MPYLAGDDSVCKIHLLIARTLGLKPRGRARGDSVSCIQGMNKLFQTPNFIQHTTTMYNNTVRYIFTRYPIVARALGRVRARAKVSCPPHPLYNVSPKRDFNHNIKPLRIIIICL